MTKQQRAVSLEHGGYIQGDHLLENLEMSGNLERVREMSGMLLTVRELSGLTVRELSGKCQGKNLVMEKCPKTVNY